MCRAQTSAKAEQIWDCLTEDHSILVLTPCWSGVADSKENSEMLFFPQSYLQHQIVARKLLLYYFQTLAKEI